MDFLPAAPPPRTAAKDIRAYVAFDHYIPSRLVHA